MVKLIVWSLFYINVCSDVVDNHDKIEIAILEPIKINKLELAHSFFPSIRVLYMFVVGEVLQRLLTLTLSKNPLSLLACPPPQIGRWPNFTLLPNININTSATYVGIHSSIQAARGDT